MLQNLSAFDMFGVYSSRRCGKIEAYSGITSFGVLWKIKRTLVALYHILLSNLTMEKLFSWNLRIIYHKAKGFEFSPQSPAFSLFSHTLAAHPWLLFYLHDINYFLNYFFIFNHLCCDFLVEVIPPTLLEW